eukprot:TRINITY_DN6558_c0_g1_i1.p1 TRINITY_DN6558_c0_g1~~TRINITY_DN6558_c0_g1_i1.p1  ORF type:complete len:730 (+),score=129.79 TRINITY_DN6558_c0_g1_i1:2321-4510(+)
MKGNNISFSFSKVVQGYGFKRNQSGVFLVVLLIHCIFNAIVSSETNFLLDVESSILNESKNGEVDIDIFPKIKDKDGANTLMDWNGDEVMRYILELMNFEDTAYIDIKLVGFHDIPFKESDFTKYLDLQLSQQFHHVIETEKNEDGGSLPHRLSTAKKYLYKVSKASPTLVTNLTTTIEKYSGPRVYSKEKRVIPYTLVDSIIESDYTSQHLRSYTIYILNLFPTQRPYEYIYSQLGSPTLDEEFFGKGTQFGIDYPTVLGLGTTQRYMWLDMNAGPLTYGPLFLGDGLVTQSLLPNAINYYRPSEGMKVDNMIVDLVSFIRRTSDIIVRPSFYRMPLPPTKKLIIHLVMIHDHTIGELEKSEKFDWEGIQNSLDSIPRFYGHELEFRKTELSLLSNMYASMARTASLKTHTSQTRSKPSSPNNNAEKNNPNSRMVEASQYFDSEELHYWLSKSRESLLEDEKPKSGAVEIPVFLFDISYKFVLLLDRAFQAVSFPDMVIGIQTAQNELETVDFGFDDEPVFFDPSDATRPVLSAILQTIWGISPTELSWNEIHNAVQTNSLWSASPTPFDFFSPYKGLSFSHKDAALRNVLLMNLTKSVEKLVGILEHITERQSTVDHMDWSDEFILRWNLLKFKKDRTLNYLNLHDFNGSYVFLRSLQHDVNALENILITQHETAHKFLKCGKKKVLWIEIVVVSLSIVGVVSLLTYMFRSRRNRRRAPPPVEKKNY